MNYVLTHKGSYYLFEGRLLTKITDDKTFMAHLLYMGLVDQKEEIDLLEHLKKHGRFLAPFIKNGPGNYLLLTYQKGDLNTSIIIFQGIDSFLIGFPDYGVYYRTLDCPERFKFLPLCPEWKFVGVKQLDNSAENFFGFGLQVSICLIDGNGNPIIR